MLMGLTLCWDIIIYRINIYKNFYKIKSFIKAIVFTTEIYYL